jgi:hypothetical protein
VQVLKGRVGEKTFYVYDESTRSNTGRIGAGGRQQMLASDRPMDQPLYKLTQQSWPVFFQEGSMAFHLFSGSAIPEEMAGLWLYGTCRSRPMNQLSAVTLRRVICSLTSGHPTCLGERTRTYRPGKRRWLPWRPLQSHMAQG